MAKKEKRGVPWILFEPVNGTVLWKTMKSQACIAANGKEVSKGPWRRRSSGKSMGDR